MAAVTLPQHDQSPPELWLKVPNLESVSTYSITFNVNMNVITHSKLSPCISGYFIM